MNPNDIDILIQKIKSANSIAIFIHNNPDEDALGSAYAFHDFIQNNFNKESIIIYSGRLINNSNIFSDSKNIKNVKDINPETIFDLAIAIDTSDLSLFPDGGDKIFLSAHDSVKIDHHNHKNDFANLNIVEICPATAEIIYKIAKFKNWDIDKNIASYLYIAIFCDTGYFRFVDKSETFKICADLVDMGANPREIAANTETKKKESTIIIGKAIANTEFFFNNKLAITLINKEERKLLDGGGFDIMNMLRYIDVVDYVAVIKQTDDNKIYISFRSTNYPVDKIAAKLGGGGHRLAAGARIPGSLSEARETVLNLFEKTLGEKR